MGKSMLTCAILSIVCMAGCGKEMGASTPPVKVAMTGAPITSSIEANDLLNRVNLNMGYSSPSTADAPPMAPNGEIFPESTISGTVSNVRDGRCGGTKAVNATVNTSQSAFNFSCFTGSGQCSGSFSTIGSIYMLDYCEQKGMILNGYLNTSSSKACSPAAREKMVENITGIVYVSGEKGATLIYNSLSITLEYGCGTDWKYSSSGSIGVKSNDSKTFVCSPPVGKMADWTCK